MTKLDEIKYPIMTKWEILKEHIKGLNHPLKVQIFHAVNNGEFRVQDGKIIFEYAWGHVYDEDMILGITYFDNKGFALTVLEKDEAMLKQFQKKEIYIPSAMYMTIIDYYTVNDPEGYLRASEEYKGLCEKFKLAKDDVLKREITFGVDQEDIFIGTKIKKLY